MPAMFSLSLGAGPAVPTHAAICSGSSGSGSLRAAAAAQRAAGLQRRGDRPVVEIVELAADRYAVRQAGDRDTARRQALGDVVRRGLKTCPHRGAVTLAAGGWTSGVAGPLDERFRRRFLPDDRP